LSQHRGQLQIEQFPKGHSNLTYAVRLGTTDLVLRRPPFGAAIKTAHDMSREYRVLSALANVYPLAPRPLLYCDDEAVIGAPFFLMDRRHGVILRGSRPPATEALTRSVMAELSGRLIDNLAELHSVDAHEAGLDDLGRPEGYVRRQIEGWTERYRRAKTDEIPAVERAAEWLASFIPSDAKPAIIHNDYKYDNLVLDPADPTRIVAVLDWEMATYGDPLMDLGTTLGYWIDPTDPEPTRMLPLGPTLLEGNLTRIELVERYQQRSGRDVGNVLFYYVYGLLKIAVIAQQIYKRFKDGHTSDPRFAAMLMGVQILSAQAKRAIDRGRIDDLG
jgi:aminoglycoside phosphotransferase (APT) family kinase protein